MSPKITKNQKWDERNIEVSFVKKGCNFSEPVGWNSGISVVVGISSI